MTSLSHGRNAPSQNALKLSAHRLMLRLGALCAHLRAMAHHFVVAHAAMLRRIMLSGIVATLRLLLLHHLAVPHHFFMAHRLVAHPMICSARRVWRRI